MTYQEKSNQIAADASIAVYVLVGRTPGDAEFLPLKPRMADDNMLLELKARYSGRSFPTSGVFGLCGGTPMCAFSGPLSDDTIRRLAESFLAYLRVMLADSFAEYLAIAIASADDAWLERYYARLYALPN